MVSPTTTCLRATRLTSRLSVLPSQPICVISPAFSSVATHSRRALSSSSKNSQQQKSSTTNSLRAQNSLTTRIQSSNVSPSAPATIIHARFNSTTASTSSSSSSTSSSPSSANSTEMMTWDRYLQLRTSRRRYNTTASIVSALGTTFVGAGVIANQDMESLGLMTFGLDPIVVMGMATMACGAVGWVMGPFAGSAVWGIVNRKWKGLMDSRERDFYRRIKKHRSAPVGQSMNNPVPDYYGEKITSVKDYRRWLKDQRAFRKKRDGSLV